MYTVHVSASVLYPGSCLIHVPSLCSIFSSVGPYFLFLSRFFLFSTFLSTRAFASFNRGQPPARQTKVVDSHLCPLKSGGTCLCVPVCASDTVSLKPTSVGRGTVDVSAQANSVTCDVCCCGSVRCKTCKHISQGSSFM